jgi:phospholipid-binding lipoprotein MlaA
MKAFRFPFLLLAFVVAGCAHNPDPFVSSAPIKQAAAVSHAGQSSLRSPEIPTGAETNKADDFGDITEFDDLDKGNEGVKAEIADPLEPFNRAMYHFNDKLYFWVLKPVAQGYGKVVPETARIGIDNFFKNLAFPIRFVNCLLQANFGGAAEELGRFTINTIWGIGGLLDPAASEEINLSGQDEDFGQTLGAYGIGPGFYINWPIFGPSSPRDTVGMVGDTLLRPFTYLSPWYVGTGARAYGMVNDTSLNIGDYEALKGAAIDPYVAIRDAYAQYRLNKVRQKGGNPTPGNAGLQKK